jgi:hypothetical protein
MKVPGYRHPVLQAVLGVVVVLLALLAISAEVRSFFDRFPIETLITVTVLAITGIAIVLYLGELVILCWAVDSLCWAVDFLSEIGMPRLQAKSLPLEYEQVGDIIIVKLRNNVATIRQCLAVQRQLKRLVDERRCNFVLDFRHADRTSKSFRAVMARLAKAARKEAAKLGKPYRPIAVPRGAAFKVFNDQETAVKEMSKHDGHGWVVLCSVPVGIRAVSDLV